MNDKNTKRAEIGNALVWAAMMIASSLLTSGSDGGETLTYLMIAGWLVTHNLVSGSNPRCDLAFLRRRRD